MAHPHFTFRPACSCLDFGAHCCIVKILRTEHEPVRCEQLRFDHGPQQLFRCHAMIADKAAGRKRGRTQHTGPACHFCTRRIPQQKTQAHGCAEGQKRTHKLPRVEPEKDRLLILADFFWDFDLDRLPSNTKQRRTSAAFKLMV